MADVTAHVADGIATAGWVYFVADVNASYTHFLIHFYVYIILLSLTFSSVMRKPCWKLAKACLLSQI